MSNGSVVDRLLISRLFVGEGPMLKVSAFVFVAVLGLRGDAALAAERAQAIPAPHCETIDAIKASTKEAKFTALSPGQFHFMAGVYVASPITPPGGMPPGDGALLIEIKDKAALVWTRGKQACITQIVIDTERHLAAYVPLPVDAKLLSILRSIKTGADETVDPDDSSEDRRL
jgi:hypothetical protein